MPALQHQDFEYRNNNLLEILSWQNNSLTDLQPTLLR